MKEWTKQDIEYISSYRRKYEKKQVPQLATKKECCIDCGVTEKGLMVTAIEYT